jgi:predicted GNAT family acetyltransferase
MSLRSTGFKSVPAFLETTQLFLQQNEPASFLLLNACATQTHFQQRRRHAPYMVALHADDRLVAAAMLLPARSLLIYCGHQYPEEIILHLANQLDSQGRSLVGVTGPEVEATLFARAWQDKLGCRSQLHWRQRPFICRQPVALPDTAGRLRLAAADDYDLVVNWMVASPETGTAFSDPDLVRIAAGQLIQNQDVYLWEDEQPVAMVARGRRSQNGVSVAQVYSDVRARRRGYATAAVASLTNHLLASGWQYCLMMADLSLPHVEAVCRAAGYQPEMDQLDYRFVALPA